MSLEGKKIVKYGKYGFELGEFGNPLACMCDDKDNLLIADTLNNRLQLLHKYKWSKIELQPSPILPTSAVYDDNLLYVLDVLEKQLLKYEKENEIEIEQTKCVFM